MPKDIGKILEDERISENSGKARDGVYEKRPFSAVYTPTGAMVIYHEESNSKK